MRKTQLVAVGAILLALLVSGCLGNNEGSSSGSGDDNWLDTYSPVHTVGTGSNKFWIDFPESSQYNGQNVQHLAWVEGSLGTHCVVFVVHKTGCVGCNSISEKYLNF